MSSDAVRNQTTEASVNRWLVGEGEMIRSVRDFDWASTTLGPIESWPSSLRTTVATLLHSRHPMFLWWGPELIQIYNDSYVPSFGVGKHPAALGQPGRDCWPEIWPIIGPQIEAVMRGGIASWHEDALVPIFRNGAIQNVYWTYGYSPVFDDDGNIGGTLVICTETTARIVAQAEVEQQRTRLFEFFKQVPAGVCIFRGEELTFEFANDEYERFVGKSPLVGETLMAAMPYLAGQGFDELLHSVMRTGVPVNRNEVLVRQDRLGHGNFTNNYYTFNYSPFHDARGEVTGVIALVLNVTESVRKKQETQELERQLRESQDQFRVLAESIPQLAWATDSAGNVDWYNRRFYEYTGTDQATMAASEPGAFHAPEFVDQVRAAWAEALRLGEPLDMQSPLRRHDGVFRWHLTRAVPLRDDAGRIVRWLGTSTDIDDSRRAELERISLLASEQSARREAEQASRAKDDFLTTASHELRTPLNAILGWAHMLRTRSLDERDYARATETIERNARAQVRLIEDILDGSRIITGNLHLEIRALELNTLIDSAVEAVRPAADAKRIELAVSVDPTAARVAGDPDRLQQVVWNLVSNAIKFTPKGGVVSVSLRRIGTDVELVVQDSGEGISPEFLPYVFDRFRQAQAGSTRRHGGLGLGLALVRHLVEAHGGTVRAESAGANLGSRFTVLLPVQAVFPERSLYNRQSPTPGVTPTHATLHGVTVLVVDDDDDARDLVSTVLLATGAQVTTAPSARHALELLAARPFTAMVSDIGMPGMDGYELIRQSRARHGTPASTMPSIALTAYAREEDRRLALEAGFDAHAAKPVDPDELVRLVAELTARSAE
jgi:PAS domain S-box-containing protein